MEAYLEIKHYKDGKLYDTWQRDVNGYNLIRVAIDIWQTAQIEDFEKSTVRIFFNK